MQDAKVALAYLEKLRGRGITPQTDRLEQAINALDRPARARGRTQITARLMPTNTNVSQMIPLNPARRMFALLPAGSTVNYGPVVPGYTFSLINSFALASAGNPVWWKEEDTGALVWAQWNYITTALGSGVVIFEEVYLT